MARQKKRYDGRIARSFTFDGKRYFLYGRSKQELDRKEYEKRQQLEAGKESHDNPTFDEYYERWTEARRGTVTPCTIRGQVSVFNVCRAVTIRNTGKTFGQLKLSEIIVDDIRELQRVLHEERHICTQTTNDYIAHISHVFRTAVKERRIDYNPCTLVKPLKRKEEKARDTNHRALTQEETTAFFTAAAGSYYFNVYRFAINTGLRLGEIGALYTSDIRDGLITVERTVTRLENGMYVIGDSAKTEAGRRTIPVNDTIREIIEDQKAINRALDGDRITAIHDRLFKAVERGLLQAAPVNRDIGRICKRAGLQHFTMHAFRATFATRAIEQGINPRTVQELLGHSDFSITMNLYGHVLDSTKREAMQKIIIAI